MAWEDIKLNEHLHEWDVSDARDSAIEERARELLADDGPDGYSPFSDRIVRLAGEKIDSEALIRELLPYLVAGDYVSAGVALTTRLHDLAEKESAEVARIQIDREHMEK